MSQESELKSPRPIPKFYPEPKTLSTKKERTSTPDGQLPPRPPFKSVAIMSRIFAQQNNQKAKSVSFKNTSNDSILSKHYDDNSKELYFDQCFEVVCKLGAGSFGEVYKVKSKEDGRFYAIKRSRERFRGESDRKRKLEEVAKHEQLPKHRNCVQFVRAWEERQHLYIQTELCETSLYNFCEQNHDIPECLIWKYLVDLLLALKHLHDNELIHMDIKPANIFISQDGICKLGDFGLVVDTTNRRSINEAQEGDPKYLSPELMEGKFTTAADVFSLGITVLELACDLDLPRGGDTWQSLRSGILPSEFTQKLSPNLRRVISWMMTKDYKCRPSVEEVLNSPALYKIWKRRSRETWIKDKKERLRAFCQRCVLLLWITLLVVAWPVTSLYSALTKRTQSDGLITAPLIEDNWQLHTTGNSARKHPSDWDYSYSDDEVYDDDLSLARALDTTSSSAESDNGNPHRFSPAIVNSTPLVTSKANLTQRLIITPSLNLTARFESTPSPNLSVRLQQPTPASGSGRVLRSTSKLTQRRSPNEKEGSVSPSRLYLPPKNLSRLFDSSDVEDE